MIDKCQTGVIEWHIFFPDTVYIIYNLNIITYKIQLHGKHTHTAQSSAAV